jgi:hypothetical protein
MDFGHMIETIHKPILIVLMKQLTAARRAFSLGRHCATVVGRMVRTGVGRKWEGWGICSLGWMHGGSWKLEAT